MNCVQRVPKLPNGDCRQVEPLETEPKCAFKNRLEWPKIMVCQLGFVEFNEKLYFFVVAHFVHEFWRCSNQTCLFVEPPSEPFNPPCGPSCLWPAKSEWQQWCMNKKKQRRPANTSPKRQNTPMSDVEFSQERPKTEKINRRLTQNLVFSIFDVFSGCPKRTP